MKRYTTQLKDYSAEAWLGAAKDCLEEITVERAPKNAAFIADLRSLRAQVKLLQAWAKEDGL